MLQFGSRLSDYAILSELNGQIARIPPATALDNQHCPGSLPKKSLFIVSGH